MIKAVIFDIDGVLLDSVEANYQYYLHLSHRFEKSFVSKEEYRNKYYSYTAKRIMEELMGFSGQDLEEKFLQVKNTPHFSDLYKVPQGEKEAIKELSKRFILAIVTGRYDLSSTFRVTGLEDYFKVTVKFGDYKKSKPDPESLIIASNRLKIKPEEAIYVGDSEEDLRASRAAGMKFIGFPLYSGKKLEGSDAIFMNFKDLPKILESLNEK